MLGFFLGYPESHNQKMLFLFLSRILAIGRKGSDDHLAEAATVPFLFFLTHSAE